MRCLVAWHVVVNNFSCGGDSGRKQTSMDGEPFCVFARWGALAAPWFFLLSGFVNSYSKLTARADIRDKEEDFIHAMLKRAITWYPFYLAALIWCAIRVATTEAEDWAHFLAHASTVQGLLWENVNETFPYLTGDVWFSWFVPYLLTWSIMHGAMADGNEQAQESFMKTVFYMSFFITIPSVILEWIWFGNFPLYLMIQLWPSFVFGQA